ncbi:unnamed protein product, partial [Staurois parvus]
MSCQFAPGCELFGSGVKFRPCIVFCGSAISRRIGTKPSS